ncbi:hypothetical protein BJI67_11610 [Acidihalobacter aeolianus]|uniref:Uncharacterized protein n=1 Tax=Acidihalobacter aeolianus TaxID=2792603 RepID=A0A1D8K9J5_9GAMM|nr:hypothetical protein [Acidihalobacter aeolianus]AOV17620.1 hypothetical protein BJI67_11610 [Acidihalobacter aeolianus]
MGDVVPFRRPSASEKHRGNTLCRRGFHKWVVEKDKRFDVKQGRLVTVYRCARCGKDRIEAH